MKILDSRFSILDRKNARPHHMAPGTAINRKSKIENRKFRRAFSLVEVLAAVALIGIITFLALPNIVRIKQDSEESLAISRAEALNLSTASYIQAHGQTGAVAGWAGATTQSTRYALLAPYLAFAPAAYTDYMPGGYSVTLPATILPLTKVALTGPSGSTIPY
jgi:prepilin-type N-terminal cleavage/methylation domain-containing protein